MSVPVNLDPQVGCALAPQLGGLAPQLCALAHGPARHPLGTMLIQSQAVDSLLVCFQCVCVCHPVHVGATLLILISIISSRLRLLAFFSASSFFYFSRTPPDSRLRWFTLAPIHLRQSTLAPTLTPVSGFRLQSVHKKNMHEKKNIFRSQSFISTLITIPTTTFFQNFKIHIHLLLLPQTM